MESGSRLQVPLQCMHCSISCPRLGGTQTGRTAACCLSLRGKAAKHGRSKRLLEALHQALQPLQLRMRGTQLRLCVTGRGVAGERQRGVKTLVAAWPLARRQFGSITRAHRMEQWGASPIPAGAPALKDPTTPTPTPAHWQRAVKTMLPGGTHRFRLMRRQQPSAAGPWPRRSPVHVASGPPAGTMVWTRLALVGAWPPAKAAPATRHPPLQSMTCGCAPRTVA